MTTYMNLPYRTINGVALAADVYVPDGPGTYPAVVVAHGGGDTAGDKGDPEVVSACQQLVAAGYVAAAVNYRLSPATAPAPADDVRAAVQACRTLKPRYKVNPAHVGVLGFSWGGYLALMAATAGTPGADRPEVAASWSGPTDLVADCAAADSDPTKCAAAAAYMGFAYAVAPTAWELASPALCVTGLTCPCYLANSTKEVVPLTRAQEMADALAAAAVPYELQVVQGALHATQYAAQVTQDTLAFLAAHI